MLRTIASAGTALALLTSRLAALRDKTVAGKTSTDKADDTDSPAAEALKRSREALEAMKQANAARKAQRKAAAREKVERLKKELEALRMMAGTGDPKAVARRAKQIARELAAAAKEYAAAGGGGGTTSAAAAASTTSTAAAASTTSAAVDATTASPVAGASAAAAASAVTTTADGGRDGEVDAEESEDGAATDDAPQGRAAQDVIGDAHHEVKADDKHHNEIAAKEPIRPAPSLRTPEEERQATAEAFRAVADDLKAKGQEAEADAKFAAEVRFLYNQIKAIIAQQRQRVRQQGGEDEELERLAKDIAEAGADIDAALNAGAAMAPVDLAV